MDLDNINDIEILREAAKRGRVKLKKDIVSNDDNYIFQKGLWYYMAQDRNGVYIFSEKYDYSAALTYETAREYLEV